MTKEAKNLGKSPKTMSCHRSIGYMARYLPEAGLEIQRAALREFGCRDNRIHEETYSSIGRNVRPVLAKAQKDLRRGDTFVIHSHRVLGKSIASILPHLIDICEKADRFVCIAEPLDTRELDQDQLLKSLRVWLKFDQDSRRSLILEGQRASSASPGRKRSVSMHGARQALAMRERELTWGQIIRVLGTSKTTIRRAVKDLRDGKKW